MNDVQITLVGNVATDPAMRTTRDQTAVCNFRVAATPRRFDRSAGSWVDGEVMFLGVTCWRRLADNAFRSLSKGDGVTITGRLTRDKYLKDGEWRESWEIDATAVGVDLARATAKPVKPVRSPDSEQVAPVPAQEAA